MWLEFETLREYKTLYDYTESKKVKGKKSYIFLDEVQDVDGFEKVVNSLNAKGDAEVFITGSNSKLLSGELATYLTGRFYTIEILPLSYKEVREGFSNSDEGFLDYLRTGGMPGKFLFEEDRTAKNYLMDIDLLQRFMSYLIHNIGQIFSAVTITNYLAAKSTYLVHGVPRYNIKGKELMKTKEKYFINDLGIRNLYFDNEKDIGQSLEKWY